MERINKATLFVNLLFFGTKKEEIYKNRLRLGVAVLFLEYTFVFRERKDINYNANAIEINKILDWLLLLRNSRHLWNKSLIYWQMHYF